jgi:AcrR family transcriptional regulator
MPLPSPPKLGSIATSAQAEQAAPALRADAARNRARIVAAAIEVFAERGLEASTADVAERAGVGEATLYRRFPTKDALIVAILEQQMNEVIAIADECLADPDPGHGIECFLREMVERSVADRGVSEATKNHCLVQPQLEEARRAVMERMTALVKRAQEAGAVRADITGADLGLLIGAATAAADIPFPGLRGDLWKRYLGIILDGIRPEGATKLRPGPPPRRAFERPEL